MAQQAALTPSLFHAVAQAPVIAQAVTAQVAIAHLGHMLQVAAIQAQAITQVTTHLGQLTQAITLQPIQVALGQAVMICSVTTSTQPPSTVAVVSLLEAPPLSVVLVAIPMAIPQILGMWWLMLVTVVTWHSSSLVGLALPMPTAILKFRMLLS
jgi:hypothetical protein